MVSISSLRSAVTSSWFLIKWSKSTKGSSAAKSEIDKSLETNSSIELNHGDPKNTSNSCSSKYSNCPLKSVAFSAFLLSRKVLEEDFDNKSRSKSVSFGLSIKNRSSTDFPFTSPSILKRLGPRNNIFLSLEIAKWKGNVLSRCFFLRSICGSLLFTSLL